MKLSIAWIFDHINVDWRKVDIPDLVDRFNKTTAEIEGFEKISVDLKPFSLVQIKSADTKTVTATSSEWKEDISLAARKDANVGDIFFVIKDGKKVRWATAKDFGCEKDNALPALFVEQKLLAGNWKKEFETEDWIIDVDNKSITNRPDMWGHRGFAREVAAILNVPFKPLDEFIIDQKIIEEKKAFKADTKNPIAINDKAPEHCKRFAGLYINDLAHRPSLLWMASRLMRVDSKPIDAIVDITNYVMLDTSQPMHAFDTQKLSNKLIEPRMAKNKEKLILLDGQDIELTDQDLIITDGKKPIALAGVMGGKDSGISASTKSVFLESANFAPTSVRFSAARYKVRTEASARFEKTLDPNQNVTGIQRFLKLLEDANIPAQGMGDIISIGARVPKITVDITHEFLEKRLGATLAPKFVIDTLTKLDFVVTQKNGSYSIVVPSFRATKDIDIKEDIVEEVGRFYGYTKIKLVLPKLETKPTDLHDVYRIRTIKKCMAYSLGMHELQNYGFFDEDFLRTIKWKPEKTISVQNPVSENWRQLATTLVPNMLHAVDNNQVDQEQLRFFEWGRTWHDTKKSQERKTLTGIFYDKHADVDFYDAKALLSMLFDRLRLPISWVQVDKPEYPWFMPYQTAHIMYKKTRIGTAGKVDKTFLHALCLGDAFIFEFDGDFLLNYKPEPIHFVPSSKYPAIERDISMLMPLPVTVEQITHTISGLDKTIVHVSLIDFYEKPEWKDQKSITMRFVLQDYTKTLTKQEADSIYNNVATAMKKLGAQIR